MSKGGKLIFMVDDDKVILHLLEYVFQGKNGYTVMTFRTGEDCLKNMGINPDLVVLDYILNTIDKNAMNGMETLTRIKEINQDLPVIILSGHAHGQTVAEMLNRGARKVLTKDNFFVDKLEQYIACELG